MLRPRGGRRLLPVLTAGLAIAILGRGVAGARPAAHLSSGCPEGHRIALTFDDGPNPPFTEHILSSLVAARVHATFFDEGEAAAAHPDVVRQEAAAGMAVGAHSWGHARTLPSMSRAAFSADLSRVEAALTSGLGYRPALYRAPYGRVSRTMLVELARAGYTSVGWDVDSGDWAGIPAGRIVANVLEGAHPGAIVLLHDGGLGGGDPERTATVEALPAIIDGLRRRGYELVTVPELTGAPEAQGGPYRGTACSAN